MKDGRTHRTVRAVASAAILCLGTVPSFAQQTDFTPPADFTPIVAELSSSVIGILARRPADMQPGMPEGDRFNRPSPFGGMPGREAPQREIAAGGSGFMISEDGHIVTNNHVVEGASDIQILLADGTTRGGELVGTDPATDIAVLQVSNTEGIGIAPWGDSDEMQPGAWTIAIGSPFGLGGTVTVGVLSATSRVIGAKPYDAFLQTDASINSGNSGGPLFNTSGEVIGVNTAIFSPGGGNIGIGFAVPSSIAEDVVQQLIETGVVARGFIGVSLQAVDETLARALGLDGPEGVIVTSVEPGMPADNAGIEEGDVILSIDGEAAESPRGISLAVAGTEPGTELPVTVFRDGGRIEIMLTPAERDTVRTASADDTERMESGQMGLAVSPLPELVRRNLGLSQGVGIMVQRVEPDSPASEAGLMQGDVILRAGDEAVDSAESLSDAWNAAGQTERPLLLQVNRNGNTRFVAVER